jgi:hypothetical protein
MAPYRAVARSSGYKRHSDAAPTARPEAKAMSMGASVILSSYAKGRRWLFDYMDFSGKYPELKFDAESGTCT